MSGQFVITLEDSGTFENYGFFDFSVPVSVGVGSHVSGQFGYTGYQQEDDALMYGLLIGTTIFKQLDVAAFYNGISDNLFETVESEPMYSEFQQSYGRSELSCYYCSRILKNFMCERIRNGSAV